MTELLLTAEPPAREERAVSTTLPTTPLVAASPAQATFAFKTIALLVMGAGVLWREYYILWAHRPAANIVGDAANYCRLALRLAHGDADQTAYDCIYPPGNSIYLGLLHRLSGDWTAAAGASLALCLLVPLLVFWLARQLASERVAYLSLAISSLYFPFIDYGGYFMAETPFTVLLLLGGCLWVRARTREQAGSVATWAFAAGAVIGIAATFKGFALLVALALLGVSVLDAWLSARRRLLLVPAMAMLGMALAIAPAAMRASVLVGKPTLISTNGAVNVLLGHYDERVQRLRFIDPAGHATFVQSPTLHQLGARGTATFRFAQYDQDRCMSAAWAWIGAHPFDAALRSVEHVFDLYVGTLPWPPYIASPRPLVTFFEKASLLFVTIPALLMVVTLTWRRSRADLAALAFLALPIVCLWVTVFLASSEPRYRVPFDGFAIILAAMCYLRWRAATVATATARR
jgi:4-amino-4-deoxy-L-arabinose transferase-like glycosyltransferase